MSANAYRGPLPTLTEDDMRAQGERQTLPPPRPIGELVDGMMGDPRAPEVELRELAPHEARWLIVEIADAYVMQLGSLAGVPELLQTTDEVRSAPLDHLSGFVLSLVDGTATVQDILDICAMPEVEALQLLCDLQEYGLIDVRRDRRKATNPRWW